MQPDDVVTTYADTSGLEDWVGFRPDKPLHSGINQFVPWYKYYYR